MQGDAAIDVRGLTKWFGGKAAVRDLTFRVERGEIFGFLGPNGAGKTTTLRALAGLLTPSSGSVHVLGEDMTGRPLAVRRRLAYLADGPYLYDKLTGQEFLDFIADLYRVDRGTAAARARELLAILDLSDRAGDLIESYSHGMRQKLALTAALLHEPEVLLLDEPTSGLDPRSTRSVKDLLEGLARRGCAVLLSTHVLDIAQELCHRVGIVNRGSLVALGTLDDLRRQARDAGASLEDIFLELTGGDLSERVAAFFGSG